MIRSAEREHFVSHFAFVDHVDRVVRVWRCPKEQSRQTDRLWSLHSIGRISGFCRVSHRLYVTESQSRTRCSVCSALRLRRFRWGSLGEMGLALKASRTGIRGSFEADFSVLPHLSFLGFKVILKKRRKSFIFLHEDKRRKYKENAEKNDI